MADERIVIDTSQALGELAKLNKGLVDVQGQAKKTGATIDDSFDQGFALGMTDALDSLQKEYNDLKRSADVLKSALKGATDPTLIKQYAQSIGQLEAGMKKLETAGKAAGVGLKEANKGAGTGKQVFEGLFGALTKATIILAVIESVIRFTKYAVGMAESTKLAAKQFEAFTGSAEKANEIVGTLTSVANKNFLPVEDVLQAGKALIAFGETADNLPAVLGRIADVSAATGKNFNELATIYGKARTSGVLYAEDINQLVDAGIPIIQEFAKQMGVSADQVKKLASEGKISFEELQLAMFNLTEEGGKFADAAQAQSETLSGAWTRAVAVVQPAIQAIGGFVSSFLRDALDGFTIVADAIKNLFSEGTNTAIKDQAQADKEAMYEDRREYEAHLLEKDRLEQAAAKRRGELAKKTTKAAKDYEKEKANLTIAAMKDGLAKEIAQENLRFEELKKQLIRYHIDTTEATEQHNQNIVGIELKYTVKRIQDEQALIELRKKRLEHEQDVIKENFEAAKKRLEEEQAIRESEIDLNKAAQDNLIKILQNAGAKKEAIAEAQKEFDTEIQRQRLESQLAFQQGLLSITGLGDDAQIAQIKNKIAQINLELAGLKIPEPKADDKKGGKNIFSLLGLDDTFNDEDQKKIIEGLKRFGDELKSISDDIFGAKVDRADREIDLAKRQIDEAEKFYDEQKSLNEQGFANDLGLAQQQLDAAKAKEAKAIEQKKQALKEQQKIDTALQVLNLVTASANIYKSYSAIPFVGIPLAIGVIATMFGAFIAAKARAAQASKFKHGGEGRIDGNNIIVGASHDTGGVGIEAEGGEFFGTDGRRFGVVNKRMTAKHFDLLAAVNKDDRGKMRQALERITGPSMRRDAIVDASGGSSSSVVIVNSGDKKTHGLLKDIKDKSQKTFTVEGGYSVMREGNFTRRRRIRA